MNVLAYVHLYGPDHCAGAEMYLHEMLLGPGESGVLAALATSLYQ